MNNKLKQKLREGREAILKVENYEIFDYYGVMCLLEPDETEKRFNLTWQVAAVKNSESEEFLEDDVVFLKEKEVVTEVNIDEFKEFMYASYRKYQNQFSAIMPWISVALRGIDEDSSENDCIEAICEAIDEAIEKGTTSEFYTGMGFKIIDRVF